jgi:hypothetical protein
MNTTETQQREGQRRGLRPFVKGDSRINRRGRPAGFDEMRKLALQLACETVTDNRGRRMSCAEAILRSWVHSKEPQAQILFVQYAFGRVPPTKVDVTAGLEPNKVLRLHYAHEMPDWKQPGGPINGVNGEGTRRPLLSDAD